jgi:photoactive yellow protein
MGMSEQDWLPSVMPFGLFELDSSGVVTRYTPAEEPHSTQLSQQVLGRNFFDDVLPVAPLREFKSRFLTFMTYGDEVQRFNLSFPFDHSSVRVQIVLARITKSYEVGGERLALVHLIPATTAHGV